MPNDWSVSWRGPSSAFEQNTSAIIKAVTAEASATYLGYVVCSCGESVITEVARITGGRCLPCARTGMQKALELIEVVIDGERIKVQPTGKKRYGSRGNPQTRRKAEHAKRAALRRLKYLHPEDYAVLVAEERDKRGLDPSPAASMIRTVIDAESYREGDVTPDSPASDRTDALSPRRGH